MDFWVIFLIAALAVGIFVILYVVSRFNKKIKFKPLYISLASLAFFFCLVRTLWQPPFIFENHWSNLVDTFKESVMLGFIWVSLFNALIVFFNAFFDIKLLRTLNKFFVLPCSFAHLIFAYLVANGGLVDPAAMSGFLLQILFYSLEVGAVFACSLILVIRNFKERTSAKDFLHFGLALIPMIITCLPVDLLRSITGSEGSGLYIKNMTLINFVNFSQAHRITLYVMVILPFILYFVLRKKNKHVIKFAILFMSVATLVTFFKGRLDFLTDPTDLPIHLCHTAMYLIPLCTVFKLKRLFYFIFFVNVLGAGIAVVLPNYTNAEMFISSPSYIGFFLNHAIAFFVPILMVALGLYERPSYRQFLYSVAGFAMYFIPILILNAWFTNYSFKPTNYFYANTDFVANYFGTFGSKIREFVAEFQIGDLTFTFYPLYQFLFFCGYILMSIGVWFVYTVGFSAMDNLGALFASHKKLRQDEFAFQTELQTQGREISEPKEEGKNMLKITEFSKKYGGSKQFAVYNANLEVNTGEIFGFLGPNGAGKSTIIKSIVGIQPPTSGSIEICGFDVSRQDVEAKRQTGYVPDHYALYEKLTGREYINYIADIYDVPREERDKRIEKYIDMFDLKGAFENQIKTYSHGMKQKTAIIAAIIYNPKLWILDEPLTGLDPTSVYQVKETMKKYAKSGNIVFFSSHIIDVVERICDRIAIIVKGKIKAVVKISDLEKQGVTLESFYLSQIGQKIAGDK